jgi:hypothetical protein
MGVTQTTHMGFNFFFFGLFTFYKDYNRHELRYSRI